MSRIKPTGPGRGHGPGLAVGVLAMLMGALVVGIAFGFIHMNPSSLHAPPWVLAVFGMAFIVAGMWSIFLRAADRGAGRTGWVNFLIGLFLMLSFSVISLWIGFGPGERLFLQEVGEGLHPATRPVDPTAGRIFFAIFGVLMTAVMAAFALSQGRKLIRRGGRQ